jgi:hypothetical protein
MNMHYSHPRRFGAMATVMAPREVGTLARTVPSLETDELARILLSVLGRDER